MSHPRFTAEEIQQRGEAIYEHEIKKQIEPTEQGRICVIDIETGEYEIDDTMLDASRRALAKHPGAALWGLRIGYDVVYSFGGGLEPAKH
jgi:hypothetical protein